jgi:predicted enzyme related to lactoylglutathione lyase
VLDQTARLAYLYVGSRDVDADLAFYRDRLGAEVVWDIEGIETHVAAVRLGEGPLVLLADHRPAPSVLPIWAVDDLDAAAATLAAAGWTKSLRRVEVPDGPILLLSDPSGNEVGLLEPVRGAVLERPS